MPYAGTMEYRWDFPSTTGIFGNRARTSKKKAAVDSEQSVGTQGAALQIQPAGRQQQPRLGTHKLTYIRVTLDSAVKTIHQ